MTRPFALLLLGLSLPFAALPAHAQDAAAAPLEAPAPGAELQNMRDRLGLTADQEARIQPLVAERNARLQALRGTVDPSASRRARLKVAREARGIQDEYVKQVEPILTAEQRKQWDAERSERRSEMRERLRQRN
jgi:Spy/CpxP family protein refolding chaperone